MTIIRMTLQTYYTVVHRDLAITDVTGSTFD